MKKFGIFTSNAKFWFHLHPYSPALFYYAVADCRQFIEAETPRKVDGRSKDGSVTANGFLITKDAPFIKRRTLAQSRVGSIESWQSLTDREAGARGPDIVIEALRQGIFQELGTSVRISDSKSDQYNGIDIFVNNEPAEIKTERIVSGNLFVQDEEGWHNPNVLADGTIKETPLTSFTPEPGFVGYDKDGHFVHYCHCGKWGAFGYGVNLAKGQLGKHYCASHRPPPPAPPAAPPPREPDPPPLPPDQGSLF